MEDFDEMPVDAQFFQVLGGTSFQFKPEANPDPLSIPQVPPPKPRVSLPPPPRPPLPVPVRPSPGIPPQYRGMPITAFAQEMERNLHDIIYESIYLFQRDPLTYHPFYLRLYKYITIGQHLGYVSTDPGIVLSIWQGFSTFADDQFRKMVNGEDGGPGSLNFTGERSPYAGYLLTGKVIIEGRELPQKRGKEERDKLWRGLEEKGNLLKIQWRVKNGRTLGGGGGLRGDLGVRLKFFEECKSVTFPGDVMEMNRAWEGFLGGGETGNKVAGGLKNRPNILKRKAAPAPVVVAAKKGTGKKLEEEPVVVKLEPDEEDDKMKDKVEEKDKESRHALRRIMIKVIVVPPSSSKGSKEGATAVQALSPPPSPPEYSPPASPVPCSPPGSPGPTLAKVAPSTGKKVVKCGKVKKLRKFKRRKAGNLLKKVSFGAAILRNKRKRIFRRVTSGDPPLEKRMLERQLKLERLINKERLELPSARNVVKMKREKLLRKMSATSGLIGGQLKLKKKVVKKSTKLGKGEKRGKAGNLKGRKIVEKKDTKKGAGGKLKLAPVAKKKKVEEKKKSPLRKAVGKGRKGRAKRKMSSEDEDEEEEETKARTVKRKEVVPLRRSSRQPKLKFKSYGGEDDEEDDD